MQHSFVIPAYGESRYLEETIKSVVFQTVPSEVLVTTSTPNGYIRRLAEKYDLQLYVNPQQNGIQADWNFAANHAKGKYVTIAHQDDLYGSDYTGELLRAAGNFPDAVLYYTKYIPIIHGTPCMNFNKAAKDLIQRPMKSKKNARRESRRHRSLAFGNSILCPSVTYNRELIEGDIFTSDLKFSLDWDTFEKLSHVGPFCYIPEELVMYRVWDGSETAGVMKNQEREREDRYMLEKFWPRWIVNLYFPLFRRCYKEYEK